MKNYGVIIVILTLFIQVSAFNISYIANAQTLPQPVETIQAKDYSYLFDKLQGLSPNQLKQHYQLYTGYVNKLSEINSKIKSMEKYDGNATYSEVRALQTSKGFANNAVVLHEYYFSNLTSNKTQPSATLSQLIQRDFGSYEKYVENLKATAKSARNGWAVTGYSLRDNKLHNYAVDLHDIHSPIQVRPILVLDSWEHAFMVDYGINRDAYLDAFLKNVDWNEVSRRLDVALKSQY